MGGTELDATVAKLVARNQATFRTANDDIQGAAETLPASVPRVPFICECADRRCVEVVRLALDEYREVRSNPRWFVIVPGHEAASQGWSAVVAARDGYVIVEKLGRAGDLAEELANAEKTDTVNARDV